MDKSVSSDLIRWKLNSLKIAGVDIDKLMSRINLTHYELEKKNYRISADKHFTLIEETRIFTDKVLSKDISIDKFYASFPLLFGLCLNSKNTVDCIGNFLKYRYIMGNSDSIFYQRHESTLFIEYKSDRPEIDQNNSAEGNFMLIHALLKQYDKNISTEVQFTRNPVISKSMLNENFNTKCIYNSNSNTMKLTSKKLDKSFENWNEKLYQLQKNEIKSSLETRDNRNFSSLIKSFIEKSLLAQNYEQGQSTLDNICETLKISRWTVNKRLQQENSSFTDLMKDARLNLVCDLLLNSDKSILEISDLTLFSSPANLSRFFSTHMNCSPLKYRNQKI